MENCLAFMGESAFSKAMIESMIFTMSQRPIVEIRGWSHKFALRQGN